MTICKAVFWGVFVLDSIILQGIFSSFSIYVTELDNEIWSSSILDLGDGLCDKTLSRLGAHQLLPSFRPPLHLAPLTAPWKSKHVDLWVEIIVSQAMSPIHHNWVNTQTFKIVVSTKSFHRMCLFFWSAGVYTGIIVLDLNQMYFRIQILFIWLCAC